MEMFRGGFSAFSNHTMKEMKCNKKKFFNSIADTIASRQQKILLGSQSLTTQPPQRDLGHLPFGLKWYINKYKF